MLLKELGQAKEFLIEQAKVDKHLDNLINDSKFNDIFE